MNVFELARSLQRIHDDLQAKGGMVRAVSVEGDIRTLRLVSGADSQEVWRVIERKMGICRLVVLGTTRLYEIALR